MKAKKWAIGSLFLVSIPIFGGTQKTRPGLMPDKQIQNLKDYAFCACLRACVPKSDSFLIKDGSSAGYFEKGKLSLEDFESIDSLAQKGGTTIYQSKYGKPLCIMKCLDFYNSTPLDSLLQGIIRENKKNAK